MKLARGGLFSLSTVSLCALLSGACSDGVGSSQSGSGGAPQASGGEPGSGGAFASGGAFGSGGMEASGGDLNGSGGMGASTSSGGSLPGGLPAVLSATGLYAEDGVSLGEGVRTYEPQFKLWTDTADKRRWIYLPPGSQIDTSDMDSWVFPPGTKLWKEFSRDGVRVETRLIQKSATGSWGMIAYLWRTDLSDADAVPNGEENASSTAHDVPSTILCAECHARVDDRVLGFTAIQLAHEDSSGTDLTLEELKSSGMLTVNPGPITVPGDEVAQAALGYLHANCGHCHNPGSSVAGQVPMYLWLNVSELGSVEQTQTYLTTVNEVLTKGTGPTGTTHRIVPGDLIASGVYARMQSRGADYSMPPLGTEDADPSGLAAVESWIMSLAD